MNKIVPILDHPDGWKIMPIHYSMDPEKNMAWVEETKKRTGIEDWEQEYEINFTTVSGVSCFENFSLIANTKDEIEYNPALPLRLACDFNVDPMSWVIGQIKNDILYWIDEIYLSPGSVIEACESFLNKYGDHYGELFIYGDATGTHRGKNDLRSLYDEIRLRFIGRPFRIKMRVSRANPKNENNVAAFNRRLRDQWGNPRMFINRGKCPELIKDMATVIWQEGSKPRTIMKIKSRTNPYFFRTHCSDAAMALVHRHWPTFKERQAAEKKEEEKRKPKKKTGRRRKRRLRAEFPA